MLVGYNLKHYRENRTFIVIEHYFILSIVCLLTFLKLKNTPTTSSFSRQELGILISLQR